MKEIKINEDTRISIGEGMKVTVTDDTVLFNKRTQGFKDGDIITVNGDCIVILQGDYNCGNFYYHAYIDSNKNLHLRKNDYRWFTFEDACRLSTYEEKQMLFNEMAKHSMTWDEQQKKIVRWRAEYGEKYSYFADEGLIEVDNEDLIPIDNSLYESGNYFHPGDKNRQESAALAIKKALASVWEDLPKYEDL